jgi:3-dehydroquinate synthase
MDLQTIRVELQAAPYPVIIGSAALLTLGDQIRGLGFKAGTKVLLVTNAVVEAHYGATALQSLSKAGLDASTLVIEAGEDQKTPATVGLIHDAAFGRRLERGSLIVALGGGVVGDMAGFAAATWLRGIAVVQVPTTLLAMVDAAIGGKTGVNHPGGKNLIGAFHQPIAVLADTRTLDTLPDRELRAGLAEVIKYGLICDEPFFAWLEQHAEALLARDPEALAHAIRRSCDTKAAIVARDEFEQGDRALLNLGHTFGHAIETATGYSSWLHGEAVGAGMLMAATLSQHAGLMDAASVQRIKALLLRVGLPLDARAEVTREAAMAAMRIDKKVKAGKLRFILMRGIGRAFVTSDYPEDALEATLAGFFS